MFGEDKPDVSTLEGRLHEGEDPEGFYILLKAMNGHFEQVYGRNREEKGEDGKDAGEWLDLSASPVDRYRSMATEYAWLAFVHGHYGMRPDVLRAIERDLIAQSPTDRRYLPTPEPRRKHCE